jgi:hypothetical protein
VLKSINLDKAKKLNIDIKAFEGVLNNDKSSVPANAEVMKMVLILTDADNNSSEAHKLIASLVNPQSERVLAKMAEEVVPAREHQLKQLNSNLARAGFKVSVLEERSAFVGHIFEERKKLTCRSSSSVKCSVSSCNSKSQNPGCNFCINCTNIFESGASGNGLCNSKHCHMVHQLVKNLDAIAGYRSQSSGGSTGSNYIELY